jgi:aspartyl-tRNA(Asn)/glutamyl-tRNA(Gln) amidotransferase subunit A
VADSAILLSGIAGYDPKDSTSVDREVPDFAADLQAGAGNDLKGMKIGVPREYHNVRGMDPDVKTRVADAIETLQALGADCIDVSLPHAEYAVAAYYVIAPSEASANLSRYDGVKYGFRDQDAGNLAEMYQNTRSRGFGPEVQRRIIIGTYALSSGYYDAYYAKASKVRTLIMDDFQKVFATCDAIVSPVAPTPAFPIGDKVDDPLTMYLSDIFTLSANLAGIPGISVPCGFSSSGLPVGLQLLGRHFDESTLFRVAHHFEQTTDVHLRKPSL